MLDNGLHDFQPRTKKLLALTATTAHGVPEDDEEASPPAVPVGSCPAVGDHTGHSCGSGSSAAAGGFSSSGLQLALRAEVPLKKNEELAKTPTAEEYERVAFAALTKRKGKKSTVDGAEKKPVAMKRPAAASVAAPAGCKRPAAASVAAPADGDYGDVIIVPELTEDARKKPRRNFQSKAYHQTKNHAKMMGLNLDECAAAAQLAHKRAGEHYDELA